MSAAERFARIVSLVAELSRTERDGGTAPTLPELAGRYGVSAKDIAEDIRVLTNFGENAESDWLLSLSIWQQGELLSVSSAGPFRRPVRLSPEEFLAVQLALAADPEGSALAARLSSLGPGSVAPTGREGASSAGTIESLVRRVVSDRLALHIEYAGEGRHEVQPRVVHPYQWVESGLRSYLVAWAPDVGGWRHFRLDRIVSARVSAEPFVERDDFTPVSEPRDLFRGAALEAVTVRFRAEVAPWVTEFFTEHEPQADGSVLVRFQASSAAWLVRRVLEFGPDAEVVGPAGFRAAVARALA